jgi:hypothetical protein
MVHDVKDTMKVTGLYTTLHQHKYDRFFHILRFLHFSDNINQLDKNDSNYDRLLKMRTLSDQLIDACAKFYSPYEHLAVDEVIVLFRGRVIFKQYILKKYKCLGIKIYKLCDNNQLYIQYECILEKRYAKCKTDVDSYTCKWEKMTRRVEGVGHKDMNFTWTVSFLQTCDNLHTRGINYCGAVKQKYKGMSRGLDKKTLKLKLGDR